MQKRRCLKWQRMFHVEQNDNLIPETIEIEIPTYTFWQKIARFFQFWVETAKHPKTLKLTQAQANHVEALFMSGSSPESIGRAFFALWERFSFKFFQTFDSKKNVFVFNPADFEIEGLELLWATMQKNGALVKSRDGLYYQCDHPMVKRLAGIAVQAPIPQKKEV